VEENEFCEELRRVSIEHRCY